jgi:hypothetical protein
MPSRFAPGPLGAIRLGFAGRKHSGIPSVTVVPTVTLRSVPAFLPGSASADASLLRSRPRKPKASLRRGGVISCGERGEKWVAFALRS